MPELDAEERDRLDRGDFAYVDDEGEGHLPIHDESHVRNALSRWSQAAFPDDDAAEAARRRILRAAQRHGIEVGEDTRIARGDRG